MTRRGVGAALALGLAIACGGCGGDSGARAGDAAILDAPGDARLDAPPDADPDAPAAFRLATLELRDPHVYTAVQGCHDITDGAPMTFSINDAARARFEADADADGALDASLVMVFRPLAQGAVTSPLELHRPRCSAPVGSTTCARSPAAAPMVATVATNLVGATCLAPTPGTLRPYMPPVTSALPPCFRSDPVTLALDVAGVEVPLRDARIAGTYFGDPAQGLNGGLLVGFVTMADARATILPAGLPMIGGRTLESVLPGGNGACTGFADTDVHAGATGWWFYFNFIAPRVPWLDT